MESPGNLGRFSERLHMGAVMKRYWVLSFAATVLVSVLTIRSRFTRDLAAATARAGQGSVVLNISALVLVVPIV